MTAAPPGPIRVLVVDDTPDIRMLLRLALGSEDDIVVVDEAGDGRAAVEAAARTQPDVVLLDLAMPVMDGLEALPLLRAASPDSQVVVLSGFEAASMAAAARAAGAAEYVQKGVSPELIIGCVRRNARPGTPVREAVRAAPLPAASVVWSWLQHAPLAVVVLDAARTRVVRHNAAAAELLEWGASVPDDAPQRLAALEQSGRLQVDRAPADDDVVLYLRPRPQPAPVDEATRIRSAIASTAHEIRNPVATVMGIAQTLTTRGDRLSPEVQRTLLTAIGRQARVLDRVTGDLLTASQSDRGTLLVQAEPVTLRPALESAVTALGEDDVTLHCPADLVAHADPVRLDQILTNLLTNARKYGAPPITVTAAADGAYAVVQVVDAGQGVPEDFLPLLFQQFARAPGTRVAGSGIGLYLVRALSEAQGGSAWYARDAGGGSRFGFALPRG